MLDFVNDGDEVLAAFQAYYKTATLADVTDPNIIYNMRAKLDALGYYDEPEGGVRGGGVQAGRVDTDRRNGSESIGE